MNSSYGFRQTKPKVIILESVKNCTIWCDIWIILQTIAGEIKDHC